MGFLLLFVVLLLQTVSWTSKGEVVTQLLFQGSLEGHPLIWAKYCPQRNEDPLNPFWIVQHSIRRGCSVPPLGAGNSLGGSSHVHTVLPRPWKVIPFHYPECPWSHPLLHFAAPQICPWNVRTQAESSRVWTHRRDGPVKRYSCEIRLI